MPCLGFREERAESGDAGHFWALQMRQLACFVARPGMRLRESAHIYLCLEVLYTGSTGRAVEGRVLWICFRRDGLLFQNYYPLMLQECRSAEGDHTHL